jgi:REP element-mobilizing transposase RayT
LKAEVLALGGIADHIHLLVEIPSTLSLAALVKQIKGSSSHLITQKMQPGTFFKWQGSYGAFSVSQHEVPMIIHYIDRQEQHHRDNTLIPEYESTETSPPPK